MTIGTAPVGSKYVIIGGSCLGGKCEYVVIERCSDHSRIKATKRCDYHRRSISDAYRAFSVPLSNDNSPVELIDPLARALHEAFEVDWIEELRAQLMN